MPTTYALNLFFDPKDPMCKKGRFLPYPEKEEGDFNFWSRAWIKKTDGHNVLLGEDNKTDIQMKPGEDVEIFLGIDKKLGIEHLNVTLTAMLARSQQDESNSESSPFRLPFRPLVTPVAIYNVQTAVSEKHPGDYDWWQLRLGTLQKPMEGVHGTRKIELVVGAMIGLKNPVSQAIEVYQLTHDPVMQVDESGG